jgi:phage shock protein PspC (stress-responsive transcriptional regulator)
MNQQINQPVAGTCTGTAVVLLLQITSAEIGKTIILAALGAAVSFVVSYLIKTVVKKLRR